MKKFISEFQYVGPIVKVPNDIEDFQWLYKRCYKDAPAYKTVAILLMLVSEFGEPIGGDTSNKQLDFQQINDALSISRLAPISKTTLNRHLTYISEHGGVEIEYVKPRNDKKKKSVKCYSFISFTPKITEGIESDEDQNYQNYRSAEHLSELAETKRRIKSSGVQLLKPPAEIKKADSEKLINYVLFGCGRLSNKGVSPEQIVSFYRYKNEVVKITTRSSSELGIFGIDDQSVMIAIITLIKSFIDEKLIIGDDVSKNLYLIDIVDICKLMGSGTTGSYRDSVRASLERLFHTNLHIESNLDGKFANDFFLNAFNGENYRVDSINFRYLQRLDSASEYEAESGLRKPRYYWISLHELTHSQLVDVTIKNTFKTPISLISNKFSMVLVMYLWACRFAKTKSKEGISPKNRAWSLLTVQQQVMPSIKHENYKRWEAAVIKDFIAYGKYKGMNWDGVSNFAIEVEDLHFMFIVSPTGNTKRKIYKYQLTVDVIKQGSTITIPSYQ